MLTNEAIEEFKQLWKQEYGREIDDEKAGKIANKLLVMMKAIYKPIPSKSKTELDDLLKQQNKYGKDNK